MVPEENWSSFHQKYNSKDFRRSAEFDRDKVRDGVMGKLVRKCSSRKLLVEEQSILKPASISKSTSSKSLSAMLCGSRDVTQRRNSLMAKGA
jgi:hypothetical protein